MSLKSKLARLSSLAPLAGPSAAPCPPPFERPASSDERAEERNEEAVRERLDDLRERIQAILSKTALGARPAPRPVDTPELPFATRETELGPLQIRVLRLPVAHRVGRISILPSRNASAELLALLALDPGLARCSLSRALYLDTETTGLSGGAGTVAFLVGIAFWESGGFTVEQLLVRNLGEEAPMLAHVAERIRNADLLVTFNGKSFDLPLLRSRYVMARLDAPVEPAHLDLVHVARRIHKARGVECRLTSLERTILGFVRHEDVPSSEVAACYLHFLRTGETRALLGVVEHNAWDVVSMASLVGLYGEPLEGTELAADDLVGVARTLKRAGAFDQASLVAERAVAEGAGEASLRVRAELAKARGDRARALADFEALAEKVDCKRVRLELSKLYEHYVKDSERALAMALAGTSEPPPRASRRVARLRAKAERSSQAMLDLQAFSPEKRQQKLG